MLIRPTRPRSVLPSPVASFPWRRPARERLLLLLVALAVLTPVYPVSSQDSSRLCLTRALVAGRVSIAPCVGLGIDRARHRGVLYSDKAPGMAMLAVPWAVVIGLPPPAGWRFLDDPRVWAVRVLTSGLAFILLAFTVGRVAEGLRQGTGGFAAVGMAVGTLLGSLAATTFDQVTASALAFGAFVLAWRRRPGVAGLLGGVAFLVEYEAALAVTVVAVYAAFAGRAGFRRFVAGLIPGMLVLGAYDWAAFGSPLHVSYRYVANGFARAQAGGFFGISLPHWSAIWWVLVGDRGLLVASPVALLAAVGLVALGSRHRREAVVCGVISLAYLLLEFGYFLPYGGVSPGPRFLIPALPFLALGLPDALRRFPKAARGLGLWSVVASTLIRLTWSQAGIRGYPHALAHDFDQVVSSSTHLRDLLPSNALTWVGLGTIGSAIAVMCISAAAFAVSLPGSEQTLERT